MTLVNLCPDTQARPTPEMRRSVAEAEVGDEQRIDTVQAVRDYRCVC